MARAIETFGFRPGRKIGARYTIEALLGCGYEGEVYQIREKDTGIIRAAKLHFPHRDPKQKNSIKHALKLNALRDCSIVLQYHHSEVITVRKDRIVALISDLCEGEPLERWVARHPGGRLRPYTALHVLYHLVRGLEDVHTVGEYHSDVHSSNILIEPRGVRFNLKLIDFYDWGRPAAWKRQQDVKDAVRVFHEILGAQAHYKRLPPQIRHICAGLRRSLILQRFPTMTALRQHLMRFEWKQVM